MLRRLKKNKKKGFTLVELIVVLVILAILAALLVPALTGYIDRAKRKSIVAETRQCVMAAQTLVDEEYGKSAIGATITISDTAGTGVVKIDDIEALAEVKGEIKSATVDANTKVAKLVYTKGGMTCTYDPTKADNNSDGDYNAVKSN